MKKYKIKLPDIGIFEQINTLDQIGISKRNCEFGMFGHINVLCTEKQKIMLMLHGATIFGEIYAPE